VWAINLINSELVFVQHKQHADSRALVAKFEIVWREEKFHNTYFHIHRCIMNYTYHSSDGGSEYGHNFKLRQMELFSCRLQHQQSTSMRIVDPLDCSFGWVNTPKTSKWIAHFGDLNFRFTYPDWLLLSAIYQQWFAPAPQTIEEEVKTKEKQAIEKFQSKPLPRRDDGWLSKSHSDFDWNEDVDSDGGEVELRSVVESQLEIRQAMENKQFNLEARTESDSNEENSVSFEMYTVFHSSDCASGWGKKDDPRQILSTPFSVIQSNPHFIPFLPFFSGILSENERGSFSSAAEQMTVVNMRLLELFPLMESFTNHGEGNLFSAISYAKFGSTSKQSLVAQQCSMWLRSNRIYQHKKFCHHGAILQNDEDDRDDIDLSMLVNQNIHWEDYCDNINISILKFGLFEF
jgi:hypothetical protein